MILLCYGTRPEYIKMKPVIEEFAEEKIAYKILFTGQHMDLLPRTAIQGIDYKLEIIEGPNRLDSIVASIMNQEAIWQDKDLTHVMVQGDTTSAMAIGLAAFHRKIPVIHLEAGLRTYDNLNPYPEEFNRQVISRLATIHLCPTNHDAQNIRQERGEGNIYVIGNTVLDNLRKMDLPVSYNNKVLITMHRRENHEEIPEWFIQLDQVAKAFGELDFVYYAHPNPNIQKHLDHLENVKVEDPLPYEKFINELSKCRFLITDSGGLQEESSFLQKKSVVCRRKTERVAGVGRFAFLCPTPGDLYHCVNELHRDYEVSAEYDSPYGNGFTAKNIVTILNNFENE